MSSRGGDDTANVLLTGMTAAQTNPVNHHRSPNFPGLLAEFLGEDDETKVQWSEPSVTWGDEYLDRFNLIIVGIAPVTGLGANRAYGALNIIERLWGDPRLRLLVDAPDPVQMKNANKAIVDTPGNLVKEFYSYRKEYREVHGDPALQERLVEAPRLLSQEAWPETIVPRLPWQTKESFARQLPQVRMLRMTNLDQTLFRRYGDRQTSIRLDRWAYEKGSHPSWLRRQGTTWPVEHLPKTHRKATWSETLDQLARSEGCLIEPSKSGTWWSPRYAMSLAVRTPVFTDWHESQLLSDSWMTLPATFEQMTPEERNQLADEQFATYMKATEGTPWTIG